MTLSPDIKHNFFIEEDILNNFIFDVKVTPNDLKKTTNKVVIEKTKKQKLKNDSSTRLF